MAQQDYLQVGSFFQAQTDKALLWQLLELQVERYVMDESSSVPIELAEELLGSIRFCLGFADEKAYNTLQPPALLDLCVDRVKRHVLRSGALLHAVVKTTPPIENTAYQDTVNELRSFARLYDARFLAHQIPSSIDYQLAHPAPHTLQGVLYVNAYLSRLLLENKFLAHFEPRPAIQLLNAYCPDYKGLLINLFEPVFTNALGLALLNKEVRELGVTQGDRARLVRQLSQGTIPQVLHSGVEKLCTVLAIGDAAHRAYLHRSAQALAPRIAQGLSFGLGAVFLCPCQGQAQQNTRFDDAAPMAGDELRSLLEEMASCRYTADKLAMLHRHVHSLADLAQVLHSTFSPQEWQLVFAQIQLPVLAALMQYLADSLGSGENYPDWGMALAGWLAENPHRS